MIEVTPREHARWSGRSDVSLSYSLTLLGHHSIKRLIKWLCERDDAAEAFNAKCSGKFPSESRINSVSGAVSWTVLASATFPMVQNKWMGRPRQTQHLATTKECLDLWYCCHRQHVKASYRPCLDTDQVDGAHKFPKKP